ncbi:MAG: hypothetical protein OJF49_003818 [Ktedonobacterales bacterium]|nr:MAG: hypothetical protein OJF49_003818 [Ktedonobacterales bacterium]
MIYVSHHDAGLRCVLDGFSIQSVAPILLLFFASARAASVMWPLDVLLLQEG